MNSVPWAVVVTPPDGTGYGTASFGGVERLCFFDPLRYGAAGGLPVPAPGDRITVATGWPTWQALWPLGLGAPTGTPGGAWT